MNLNQENAVPYPLSIQSETVMTALGDEVIVQDRAGRELARLDLTTAAVWTACDGRSAAAAIAEELGLASDTVWAALDLLADLGLIVGRSSPPGSVLDVSRRKLLTRVGLGMGVAALSTQAAMAAITGEAEEKAALGRGPRQEQRRKHRDDAEAAQRGPRQEQRRKRDDDAELAQRGPRQEQRRKRDDDAELAQRGPRQEQTRKIEADELATPTPQRTTSQTG